MTEAVCKTVYTPRLKLSGLRWTKPGAPRILNLRVCLLSGVWDTAYQAALGSYTAMIPRTYQETARRPVQKPR